VNDGIGGRRSRNGNAVSIPSPVAINSPWRSRASPGSASIGALVMEADQGWALASSEQLVAVPPNRMHVRYSHGST
jgi:hypothetical protein